MTFDYDGKSRLLLIARLHRRWQMIYLFDGRHIGNFPEMRIEHLGPGAGRKSHQKRA
jgi:hypothetical protein